MSADEETGEREERFRVELTANALTAYLAITSKTSMAAVDRALDLIGTFPLAGVRYEPYYQAARLPFDAYVVYAKNYGIYYEVQKDASCVVVDYIEDERRDPLQRFYHASAE